VNLGGYSARRPRLLRALRVQPAGSIVMTSAVGGFCTLILVRVLVCGESDKAAHCRNGSKEYQKQSFCETLEEDLLRG
jgi:hypothetical protein